jgi:hypothetical protein
LKTAEGKRLTTSLIGLVEHLEHNGDGPDDDNGDPNDDIFKGSNYPDDLASNDPLDVYRQKELYYWHPSYDEKRLTEPNYSHCEGLKITEYKEGLKNGCIPSCPWYLLPSQITREQAEMILDEHCKNWRG